MDKWIGLATQHGLAVVGALLLAIGAVGWVEPTTTGGVAFLMFFVFIVALAALEIVTKAWTALGRRRAITAAEPAEKPGAAPTGEAEDAATSTAATTGQPSEKSATGQ